MQVKKLLKYQVACIEIKGPAIFPFRSTIISVLYGVLSLVEYILAHY